MKKRIKVTGGGTQTKPRKKVKKRVKRRPKKPVEIQRCKGVCDLCGAKGTIGHYDVDNDWDGPDDGGWERQYGHECGCSTRMIYRQMCAAKLRGVVGSRLEGRAGAATKLQALNDKIGAGPDYELDGPEDQELVKWCRKLKIDSLYLRTYHA